MVDTSVVGDVGTVWAVAAQFVIAGFMGALWFQHRASRRADRRSGGPLWLMLWSVFLTILFLVNGLVTALPSHSGAGVALFLRAQVLAATVLVSLPVVKSSTRGQPIRWYVLVAGAMFVGRSVLWLTTDLVSAHTTLNGIPQNGRLLGPSFLLPLIVVAWYVAASTTRLPPTRARTGLRLASSLSLAGLLVAYLLPPGPAAELLKGAWALPLVAALHVMGQRRIGAADQRVARQHRLRDALTEIGNAASVTSDQSAILKLAETTAREQVGDATLIGSIHPGAYGPCSATFESAAVLPKDDLADAFLIDVSRIVSVAAERMRLADDLRQEALTDYLTRLPNRKALELHLKQALVRAEQNGIRLALLYCDVDEFKRENDQHGHAWGDELLQRIASHLQASLSRGTFVARVGGDEFVVVIEDAGSSEDLVKVARSLRNGLDLQSEQTGSRRCCPWGWPSGPATTALTRICCCARQMRRCSRANAARSASWCSTTRCAPGWSPSRTWGARSMPPWSTMSSSCTTSRSWTQEPLGSSVWRRSSAGLTAMAYGCRRSGFPSPRRPVRSSRSVGGWSWQRAPQRGASTCPSPSTSRPASSPSPGSSSTCARTGATTTGTCSRSRSPSDLLEDVSHAIESLTAVRALGARISIDDFGTGYSSFARLANLPVDVLKIDQAVRSRPRQPRRHRHRPSDRRVRGGVRPRHRRRGCRADRTARGAHRPRCPQPAGLPAWATIAVRTEASRPANRWFD